MPARHRSRRRAVQVMYAWDLRRQPVGDLLDSYYATLGSNEDEPKRTEKDPFMEELVRGTVSGLADIDKAISTRSKNWRIERMPAVDRNILRLAVYELTKIGTPAAVTLDEALELAAEFGGEESKKFVNGVLDAIAKDAIASRVAEREATVESASEPPE